MSSRFLRRFIQCFSLHLYLVFYFVKKFASESFMFQNLNFFRLSWHKIWYLCCAYMLCLLTQRARLSGPPRYLQRCRRSHRRVSRVTRKKVPAQNMRIYQNIRAWLWVWAPCFELELFQATLENFLWDLRQRWRYLGGLLNLALCVSKEIVTIRRTNLNICQEKWKKLRFWKWSSNSSSNILTKPHVLSWNFSFKRL